MEAFYGRITNAKMYDRCLSPSEIVQEIEDIQRIEDIRLYISLVETEGKRFLFGGPEYQGPIISEFMKNVLFLTGEMTKWLDAQRT